MINYSKPVVLVSPLNWGIGHASRLVPVIAALTGGGYKVILGISGKSGDFLLERFPGLSFIKLPSFTIRYRANNIFFGMLLQAPLFLYSVLKEHFILKCFIKKYKINIIISDNRYGLWSKSVYSVFITHQIFIRLPGFLDLFQRSLWTITRFMIERFDECWIPDSPEKDTSLSCELSHGVRMPKNFRYIGLLSRFMNIKRADNNPDKYHYKLLAILSGPEPQRTLLENILISQAVRLNIRTMIMRGLPGISNKKENLENIKFLNHPSDTEFLSVVNQSEYIICRSGYSTIMDMVSLGRNALLVPTPGQTEQEYLAHYLTSNGQFLYQPQQQFHLEKAIKSLNKFSKYPRPNRNFSDDLLCAAIDSLKQKANI